MLENPAKTNYNKFL